MQGTDAETTYAHTHKPPVLWKFMSRTRSCVGILFIISVILGIVLGYMVLEGIAGSEPLEPISPFTDTTSIPSTQNNNSHSILVIGVDSLAKAYPGLEGAWRITLEQSNGQSNGVLHFDISTLYPVTKNSVLSTRHGQFSVPHDKIVIDPNNLAALTELEPISYSREDWDDIILLDEVVVNFLISLQNPNIQRPIPTPHPSVFIKPWEDPEGAFDQQRAILTTLCDHPEPLSQPALILEIIEMTGVHLKSTLDKDGLRGLWQVINYTGDKQVVCSFYPE